MKTKQALSTVGIFYVILAHALMLKLTGLDHGLPFPLRSDEESMIGGAMRMIELRTVFPFLHPEKMEILNYPPFIPYIYMALIAPVLGFAYVVNGLPPMDEMHLLVFEIMGEIFLSARLSSVLISLGTIYLVYLIARRLFKDPHVALLAAFLLSIDFFSNFTSHFARHWNLTTLTIWACVYLAIRIAQEEQRKHYLWLGITAGLGFGASFTLGGLGIVAGGIAQIYLSLKKFGFSAMAVKDQFNNKALIMVGTFLAISLVFFALHPNALLRLTVGGVASLDDPKTVMQWLESIYFYVRISALANPVLTVLMFSSFVILLFKRKYNVLAWHVGTFLFYLTSIYIMLTLEGRYIITIMPLFALGGGYVLAKVLKFSHSGIMKLFPVALVSLIVAYPLATAWQTSLLLSRDDTRMLAIAWMDQNIPADAKIVIGLKHVNVRPTMAGIVEQKEVAPNSLNAYMRTLTKAYKSDKFSNSDFKGRAYHAVHTERFRPPLLETSQQGAFLDIWLDRGYEYFVIQHRNPEFDTEFNKRIRAEGERLAIFRPTTGKTQPPYLHSTLLITGPVSDFFSFDRFGPIVEIYKIAPRAPKL